MHYHWYIIISPKKVNRQELRITQFCASHFKGFRNLFSLSVGISICHNGILTKSTSTTCLHSIPKVCVNFIGRIKMIVVEIKQCLGIARNGNFVLMLAEFRFFVCHFKCYHAFKISDHWFLCVECVQHSMYKLFFSFHLSLSFFTDTSTQALANRRRSLVVLVFPFRFDIHSISKSMV